MEAAMTLSDTGTLEGINILIADDEELNYLLLKEYLDGSGAKISYVVNGKEAVEKCRNHPVDLVLMDIRMPVMNGIEATAAIKEFRSIPVIAVSAFAYDLEREKDLKFDLFIEKPVKGFRLCGQIREVLQKSYPGQRS